MKAKVTQVLLFAIVLFTSTILSNIAYAAVEDDLVNALKNAAEGDLGKYDILVGKFKNSSDLFIVWNSSDISNMTDGLIQCSTNQHIELDKCVPNSGPVPNPGPGPNPEPTPECGTNEVWDPAHEKCVCKPGYHQDNTEACVKDTQPGPGPNPGPTPTVTKLVVMGDVKGDTGVKVSDAAKKENADNYVTVGDSGYTSSTSYYNTNFEQKLGPDKNDCVAGNHDSEEDGSASLEKAFLELCQDHWSKVTANETTLLVGLNTNGDRQTQVNYYKDVLGNAGYKNVIVFTHKNGHVPPDSHHPAEALQLYAAIEQATPSTVNLLEIGGHNHIMGAAWEQGWFIIGAGGASHYSCGTNTQWVFCNNSAFGYLKIEINNGNGALTAGFYDVNGRILN